MTALGIDPGQADTRAVEAIVLLPASGGQVTIPIHRQSEVKGG